MKRTRRKKIIYEQVEISRTYICKEEEKIDATNEKKYNDCRRLPPKKKENSGLNEADSIADCN